MNSSQTGIAHIYVMDGMHMMDKIGGRKCSLCVLAVLLQREAGL